MQKSVEIDLVSIARVLYYCSSLVPFWLHLDRQSPQGRWTPLIRRLEHFHASRVMPSLTKARDVFKMSSSSVTVIWQMYPGPFTMIAVLEEV
jgi:hypothetical protein